MWEHWRLGRPPRWSTQDLLGLPGNIRWVWLILGQGGWSGRNGQAFVSHPISQGFLYCWLTQISPPVSPGKEWRHRLSPGISVQEKGIKQQLLHFAGPGPWTSRMAAGQLCQPNAHWHLWIHLGCQGLESDWLPAVCGFDSIRVLSTCQMLLIRLLNQTTWVRSQAPPLTHVW